VDLSGSGYDSVARYYEHGNEISGSIKCGDFWSEYQVLKKYSAP
jgi:hypothetical protein